MGTVYKGTLQPDLGTLRTQPGLLQFGIDQAIMAVGAEATGAMEVLYKATVEYCKTREQFGQSIGKFQVLQHRMVDMFIEHEQTKSLAYMAAMRLAENYDDVSRLRMLYFYLIFFVLLIAFRASLLKALKHARKEGYNFKQVIIIGANETGEKMNAILQRDLSYGYKVVGAFCNNPDNGINHNLNLLGKYEDIENYLF